MGFLDFFKNLFAKEPHSESDPGEKTSDPQTDAETRQEIEAALKRYFIRRSATSKWIDVSAANIDQIQARYIAFDVETTGLDPYEDRIVELGAVLFVNELPVERFSSLVNPGVPISAAASAVNLITNDMLETAPTEQEIYPKFIEFLGDAVNGNIVMCAHNASFDFNFLCNTLSRLNYTANFQYIDTLSLARQYVNGVTNYKQSSLERYFGLTNDTAHRAASDAENCGKIFFHLLHSVAHSDRFIIEKVHLGISKEDLEKGWKSWSQGDALRVSGDFEKAFVFFEQAKSLGYRYPCIYESYAKAYRKLKDYESEISILEEAIACYGTSFSHLTDRRNRAQELLVIHQRKEKEIQRKAEKRARRAEELLQQQEVKAVAPKQPKTRPVLQYTDDGTLISEFPSISAASATLGINSKSISDAARGKQKHAGGYCWKYADSNVDISKASE